MTPFYRRGIDLFQGSQAVRLADVAADDHSALAREKQSRCSPHAATGAGDDAYFAFEPSAHCVSPI
jgi:hypothetical protein